MAETCERSKKINAGKTLAWTTEEIVRHYRGAKDREAMIGILADLNNVSIARIKSVLRSAGEVLPQKEPKVKRKKEYVPPAVFYHLEHDGVRYSIEEVARRVGRSRTYVLHRMENTDVAVIGGVEYRVIQYTKRRG